MSDILKRIEMIARSEGITITAFERTIGASKGVLSRAISNGTDIQTKWIQAIVEKYPSYSERWLLTGKGEMLKVDNENILKESEIESKNIFSIQQVKDYEKEEKGKNDLLTKYIEVVEKLIKCQESLDESRKQNYELQKQIEILKDQGGDIVVGA